MKIKSFAVLAWVSLGAFNYYLSTAFAQGTTFTYQGQLQSNGSLAKGAYDLQFSLFDAPISGNQVGITVTNLAVGVTNGLFTTTVDFGNVFNGATLWLQIGVEINGAGGNFTTLGALQPLTSVPYAVYAVGSGTANFASYSATAGSASTASSVANGAVTKAGIASGQVVKSLNGLTDAITLTAGTNVTLVPNGNTLTINGVTFPGLTTNVWSITGNAGTSPANGDFLGTLDNQPLELHVNGLRALRLEPGIGGFPNVIGGAANNVVFGGKTGATIAGGAFNAVNNYNGTVGGGQDNVSDGDYATISGGQYNLSSGEYATISGGGYNQATGPGAFVGGGGWDGNNLGGNLATGAAATIPGGWANTASGPYATVGGGSNNFAVNLAATVAGGAGNNASGPGAFVGGGGWDGLYLAANTASGAAAVIAGGLDNTASQAYTTVDGGTGNSSSANFATVGGGNGNQGSGIYAVVTGGSLNLANNSYTMVGGGQNNKSQGVNATVGGGAYNNASGAGAFVGGGGWDGNTYSGNVASGAAATIAGGWGNLASQSYATVVGGAKNEATGPGAFVGGGGWDGGTVQANVASGAASTVVGGVNNGASNVYGTVGGGANNSVSSMGSTVGGGYLNRALGGNYATVPGGYNNAANGNYSFAAGLNAEALNDGTFVWADSQANAFQSTANDQFCIRAQGGMQLDNSTSIVFGSQPREMLQLYRDPTSTYIYGLGVQTATLYLRTGTNGGFAWYQGGLYNGNQNNAGGGKTMMTLDSSGNLVTKGSVTANGLLLTSDRNAKENFKPVDNQVVLAKVAALAVSEWNYKTDSRVVEHLGPMAQDFQAAFGLNGTDDKHISMVDEGGVALAAIQGLNEKLEARSQQLEAENAELKKSMADLKQLVQTLAIKK